MDYNRLHEMITRCKWTFAKTMPFAPHEYIMRDKCPLTDDEFKYFVEMQRQYGVTENGANIITPTFTLIIISIGRWEHPLRK